VEDIVTEPFEIKSGTIAVPDKPGLGIEIDPEKLRKYRVEC
jgi:L-alanine-DL-glutamate epimerase-like enolase superfamily enzyme